MQNRTKPARAKSAPQPGKKRGRQIGSREIDVDRKLEAAINFVRDVPFKGAALAEFGIAPATFDQRYKADKDFAQRFDDAMGAGIAKMEQEAHRRAVKGWESPVFGSLGAGQGTGVVGTERKYSDTLMIFMLKGKLPNVYRDRADVNVSGQMTFAQAAIGLAGMIKPSEDAVEHEPEADGESSIIESTGD